MAPQVTPLGPEDKAARTAKMGGRSSSPTVADSAHCNASAALGGGDRAVSTAEPDPAPLMRPPRVQPQPFEHVAGGDGAQNPPHGGGVVSPELRVREPADASEQEETVAHDICRDDALVL